MALGWRPAGVEVGQAFAIQIGLQCQPPGVLFRVQGAVEGQALSALLQFGGQGRGIAGQLLPVQAADQGAALLPGAGQFELGALQDGPLRQQTEPQAHLVGRRPLPRLFRGRGGGPGTHAQAL